MKIKDEQSDKADAVIRIIGTVLVLAILVLSVVNFIQNRQIIKSMERAGLKLPSDFEPIPADVIFNCPGVGFQKYECVDYGSGKRCYSGCAKYEAK